MAAVFVHGLFSSKRVWQRFEELFTADGEVSDSVDRLYFEYDSPLVNLNIARRIPDFGTVADSLATFLDVEGAEYARLALVTHSQGGLIVQRYLAKMLADGRGADLARIRRIIMFACPNDGSELLLLFRRPLVRRHAQERDLRPLADSVSETRRRIMNSVVYARNVAPDRCPIPLAVYAGESDNVVTRASAVSSFPTAGALPGDHSSVVQPDSPRHRSYTTLRKNLMLARQEPFPATRPDEDLPARAAVPTPAAAATEVYPELRTFDPVAVRIGGAVFPITVHAGPIDQVSDMDIVVSSENIHFQIAKPFKPSTSGRLRNAAAVKNAAGEIVEDVIFDELNDWMKRHGRHGLPVALGTVAPTSSGELAKKGVLRVYHAAIVVPRIGTNEYDVDPHTIAEAVHNVFRLARRERAELGRELRSICLPLFGAGRGRLDAGVSFAWMWGALAHELAADPSWRIHFSTWRRDETALLLKALDNEAARARVNTE